ncbi:MAG: protein-disulfide reductase DsbD family protein [Verrucomicrobiales bacterium]|nr:protein-disulfide reductase DsbD family protein [Verrucomicrobiales bacterium]
MDVTRLLHPILLIPFTALLFSSGLSAESEPFSTDGIDRLQILTDVQEIVPGETLSVGLLVSPAPGHHTYWKGPGIVGVATSIEWNLPRGFQAGPIIWPTPEKVDMVGIEANGYRREVILLTEIKVPENITDTSVELNLKSAWMACSTSCNPGVAELSLSLPVKAEGGTSLRNKSLSKRFQAIRDALPPAAPETWKMKVSRSGREEITLTLSAPGLKREQVDSLEFFCDDMQVNSDEPIEINELAAQTETFELRFARPTFAPSDPEVFSGLLKGKANWPNLDSTWVEISVPWKRQSSHE